MTSLLQVSQTTTKSLIAKFFEHSQGDWHSERRYFRLPEGKTQEVTSLITIRFLEPGSVELLELQQLHELDEEASMSCGTQVSWKSIDAASGREQSIGETVIGAMGSTLYRDRGFATVLPVTSTFHFSNPQTLCMLTEYNGAVFEEELKLVGQDYRTRQTFISRAGEQQMITHYLEKRIR